MADWRASLFDRLNPSSELEKDDKDKLMRQGLLGLAAGMLSQRGFGPGLAAGIQNGLLAMNEGQDSIHDRRLQQQKLQHQMQGGGKPAQQQYAEWLLQQVPEDKRAKTLGYLAGYESRPSSAAINYEMVEIDGRKVLVATDPRDIGAQTIGGGPSYGSFSQPPVQPSQMGGDPLDSLLTSVPGLQPTSRQRTPERNAQVGGVPNSYHLTGQAMDILPPQSPEQAAAVRQQAAANGLEIIDEGDHWHLEPRSRPQRNPFASRRPEDEAAAVEAAKIDATLARGSAVTDMEAQRARAIEEAKLAAQLEGDKAASMPKRRLALQQATNKAANLNRALESAIPNVNAWTAGTMGVPLSKLGGSAAADLRANLDTIEAIVAFDELQQMRASSPTGGALGSVTERELNLLASTIANVKQSQSPEQLRENLAFLGEQYNKVVQQMLADFAADAQSGGTQGSTADPLGIL